MASSYRGRQCREAHDAVMSYADWNEKLVDHVFGRSRDAGPVLRIPATPEELCVVAGRDPALLSSAQIDTVVRGFLECIREELHAEKLSFLRYCLHYREDRGWWSTSNYEQPYFFAMLWLTCLVAYGFPAENDGDFYARLRLALDGNASLQGIALGGLDDVWEDLEKWTRKRPEYRHLVLPPRCPHRTIIGRSHFLAFPHRLDRAKLAAVLQDAGLAGQEPPVRLVLEALLAERDRFSDEFGEDLDSLFTDYIEQGRDPKDSPLWRAVRQAARDEKPPQDVDASVSGRARLLAEWDEDELVMPYIGYPDGWPAPPSWVSSPLEFKIGELSRRALLEADVLESVLHSPNGLLRNQEAQAVTEGVIPLFEEASGVYRVAIADEIASCEMALVRSNLAATVRTTFGGRLEESGFRDWMLVTNARLEQRDQLDGSLSAVRTLLQTTDAPRPALVGGIRSSGNTFYALERYLPQVRARHAANVVLRWDDAEQSAPCSRLPGDEDRWLLPSIALDRLRGANWVSTSYELVASYENELMGRTITREARVTFQLQRPVLVTDYKGIPPGSYRLETCTQTGGIVTGPRSALPLGFTSEEADNSLDLLPLDPTSRWLGPGLGEMSLAPRIGFPWLVAGPKKRPEYIVLVEDPGLAPTPSAGQSPFVGDRRHWAKALAKDVPAWWRRTGTYVAEADWPDAAKELLGHYRGRIHAKRSDVVAVPETHLDSHLRDSPWGFASSPSATLHDVLAALFHNRGGIPLREIHEHMGQILGLAEAHSVREQLVRALVESAAIDTLRCSVGCQTLVVGRRPRLMGFRRGPRWMAVLTGLAPALVRNELRMTVERIGGATIDEQRTSVELLPGTMRVDVSRQDDLIDLSRKLGFAPPEYVEWADIDRVPDVFRIDGALRSDPVPDMYLVDATWCWTSRSFRREPEDADGVVVERRRDGRRAPIYIVRHGYDVLGWSYYRTWALLRAHEVHGRAFLHEDEPGVFTIPGASPLHLPLPIARLCAVAGLGTPGPRLASSDRSQVEAYCYPLGPHLRRLLVSFLPSSWLVPRKQ